ISVTTLAAATANSATISGDPQPADGPSIRAQISVARNAMTSSCPHGSNRRAMGARDSGTNSWVKMMAATPIGMLIQKMARQMTSVTSTPPITGPRARLTPNTAPHTPRARARAPPLGERVADDGQRDRVEHRAAQRLQAAERDQPADAGGQAAQQRPQREQGQPDLEHPPPPEPVSHRAGRHQEAGDD